MPIALKRAYDKPSRTDGTRVLVDRLWPRGLSKAAAAIDAWFKDLAPSDELRKWFHAHTDSWDLFRRRYIKELARAEAAEPLQELHELATGRRRLTLLFASKDKDRNNAVVLKDLLEGMRKPPTGTGPAASAAGLRRAARPR
jgi:uncharacterized protein YeaO (DUF488 family)